MKKKLFHNLMLAFIVLSSLILVFKLQYSFNLQVRVMIVLTLSYLIWAFIYHQHDKSLTKNIMIEYILTAALVLVIITGTLI